MVVMGIVRGFQEEGKKGVFPHSFIIFIIMSQTTSLDKEEQASCHQQGGSVEAPLTVIGQGVYSLFP